MKLDKYFGLTRGVDNLSGLYSVAGSFGIVDGTLPAKALQKTADGYLYENGKIRLATKQTVFSEGAVLREDSLTNISSEEIVLNRAFSRFTFEGGKYEIYTQENNWQHESVGSWMPLGAEITAAAAGLRTCQGATPIMALYNVQSGKTTVFHLFPNAAWKMSVSKRRAGDKNDGVALDCGFNDSAFALRIAPGETVAFPAILYFEAKERRDLDAHKLHAVYNKLFPRKSLPILYNTWLLEFDNIRIDNIFRQIDTAAELGIETFVIDAGWFGTKPEWDTCIGEWTENTKGGFCGRVSEISEYVRSKGMGFGMWLEPERALPHTESVKEHPDYYIHNEFLDFANDEARQYIFDITCGLIEKYHLSYMKFDFNNSFAYDPSMSSFYRYLEGQKKYVKALKERYPNLYLTNCASGGFRMELEQAKLFDSFWISDNQGPYEGLDIFKNTALRMPASCIEKWNVQTFCGGFPEYKKTELRTLPISCNNATWDYVLNVSDEYTFAFLSGGVIGFSCNIADFPAAYKVKLKAFLDSYKKDRAFFAEATMRVLTDVGNITVLEYASADLSRVELQVFTKLVYQDMLTVYPVLDENARYILDGKEYDGKELAEDGIVLTALKDNNAVTLSLKKIS